MKKCKKCSEHFEPIKGLKNYCSISCRNSRNWTEEDKLKKSESNKKWFTNLSDEEKKMKVMKNM